MTTKAILFDVDGTLVDSNRFHARAWSDAFAQFGITIPVDTVQGQIGKGGDTLMPALLDPDVVAAALEKAGVAARDAIVVGDRPYDMEAASKLGIPAIAVRSGGFDDEVLTRAGALAIFDHPAELLARYDASPLATAR